MPTNTATSSSTKRPNTLKDVSSSSSQSLADGQIQSHAHGQSKQTSHHKLQRHVVGHGRLGARNPSYGRNLSKISAKDDDVSSSPRRPSAGSLTSPRPKSHVKRNHSLANIMPKNASHSALRKNHSSGHLARNSSSKQLSKVQRPEYQRSHSHPHGPKSKRKHSPAPTAKHPTVHFDVGSDDEGEEMEGVDDGWTEESGSQSPNTTRDNTRANTRSNSVSLDHNQKIRTSSEVKPPDKSSEDGDDDSPEEDSPIDRKSDKQSEAQMNARLSSYQETAQHRPPDADAIAKRLLQKQAHAAAPPQLSDVSVSASTEALDSKTITVHENGQSTEGSTSGTPLISRFIDSEGNPSSKMGTPVNGSQLLTQRNQLSPAHSARGSSDIKRNQSTPSFNTPHSPGPDAGPGSGSTTPGGLGHGGRIQQKMWLQRGLSEIESRSQQNLRGMLAPGGRTQRLGAQPDQSERIETELKVVRRYRHPVEESMERLRKLKDSPLRDALAAAAAAAAQHIGPSPSKKSRSSRDGARTPISHRQHASQPSSPPSGSLATSTPDGEGTSTPPVRSRKDWDKLTVDDLEALRELEELTLDVRRQMWEIHLHGEVED